MPEHLRALVIITILAYFIFYISKITFSGTINNQTLNLWRNTWFSVTFMAFFAHNFWLFLVLTAFFIKHTMRKESNKIALLLLVSFIIPPIAEAVPGFGVLQQLLTLDYLTFLSLFILLPIFMANHSFKFGKVLPDKLLFLFLTLVVLLQLRDTTFTDALRRGFLLFSVPFLTYYASSRVLNSVEDIKKSSTAFMIASLIAGIIGVFEYLKHWLLYGSIAQALNTTWKFGGYMDRGGATRAMASLGHPIILGYMMAISIGFYLMISPSIKKSNYRKYCLIILVSGLIASLSRGPWMGALAGTVSFIATGSQPVKKLAILACSGVLLIGLATVIPGGEKYYNLLPFIGTTQAENVEYRQRLFTNSMIVINKSPFFGSTNYLDTPEMKAMIQGEGIIDLVNSYIQIALAYGYVGACLFIGFFISIIFSIYKTMKKIPNKLSDEYLIGRALIAIIVSILVTIATVSAILAVPFIYSIVAGMGVAYCKIMKKTKQLSYSA